MMTRRGLLLALLGLVVTDFQCVLSLGPVDNAVFVYDDNTEINEDDYVSENLDDVQPETTQTQRIVSDVTEVTHNTEVTAVHTMETTNNGNEATAVHEMETTNNGNEATAVHEMETTNNGNEATAVHEMETTNIGTEAESGNTLTTNKPTEQAQTTQRPHEEIPCFICDKIDKVIEKIHEKLKDIGWIFGRDQPAMEVNKGMLRPIPNVFRELARAMTTRDDRS